MIYSSNLTDLNAKPSGPTDFTLGAVSMSVQDKSVTVEVCNGWSTVQANLNFSRYFTNKLYENW